jgi:WD40 repeat protein
MRLRLGWLIGVGVLALAASSRADELPTAPILRIESGMHGAAINRIAVRAGDRQLVTVSDDKTIRVWSTENGQLLETLRGPIGSGPEGALYAVALSPSGKSVAAAGHTGISWDGSAAVYFFNRETGIWIGRIGFGGVKTDVINALAFSPDGNLLAVGANDAKGLRIVDLKSSKVSVADDSYGDAITGLDFAADGRLVTASLDGTVRLYDAALKRVATAKPGAGKPGAGRPWSVAFDATGARVAVGFIEAAKVAVLSGRDLKPMSEQASGADRRGALSVVAWAADGKSLFAAGTYGDAAGRKLVRRWPVGGGTAIDIAVGDDTVTDLRALPDGAVAFATAEPAWGIVDAGDKVALRQGRSQADFRDGYQGGFLVSQDGATVDFGFAQGGKQRARFDLLNETLEMSPVARDGMKASAEKDGALAVTDWRNGDKPKLGGKPVALDPNERSRSVAVLPGGSGALLGTDYFLRLYRGGNLAWRTAVPAPAWAVNVAGDGRLAIAGLGDGTIRWFRVSDGSEILALYAHPDGQRWVAWTPEGFFDHGTGGESLIGYHLNLVDQGRPRGGTFVRVEQLYTLFFRRDLVVEKFRGNAEDHIAVQLAEVGDVRTVLGRGLPPRVRLTEYCTRQAGEEKCLPVGTENRLRGTGKLQPVPAEAPEVVLRFEVEDQGGGNGPIMLRRQGAPVAASGKTRSVAGKVRQEERVVQMQPGLNLVSLSVFNAAREIETDPKERPTIAIRFEAPSNEKPVLRVLAVGVDRFGQSSIPPLANAANDAAGIVENLKNDKRKEVFSDVDATLLTNDKATLQAITDAFAALAKRAKPDDLTVIFLAGHGVALDGKYYFLPYDLPGLSPESVKGASLTHQKLADALNALPTSRTVVILDTCFSGAFAVSDSLMRDSRDQTLGKQMSHTSGRFILAGSSSQEEALDGVDGHGVLTGVLLKGLSGDADRSVRGDRDGKVSVMELGEFAKTKVPELAVKVGAGHSQKPRWFFNGDDIFDVRSADAPP